jgi:methylated-DNA-[protein]-cysteine S-methyltransferase
MDILELEPAMTEQHFAIFDTEIGPCGIVWGARGITGVQLPMGSDEKTRNRIHHRTAGGQAERSG